jgi:hypothetical protein
MYHVATPNTISLYIAGIEMSLTMDDQCSPITRDSDFLAVSRLLLRCEEEYLQRKVGDDDELVCLMTHRIGFFMHVGHCCLQVANSNPFFPEQRMWGKVMQVPLPLCENVGHLTSTYLMMRPMIA